MNQEIKMKNYIRTRIVIKREIIYWVGVFEMIPSGYQYDPTKISK